MKKIVFSFLVIFVPIVVNAATKIGDVFNTVQGLLNKIVPILITLAILYFVWGLATFIKDSGNEEKRTEGKHKMFWGVIGLFVIFSVWGLVALIANTFDIERGGNAPNIPQFPESSN